MSLAIHMNGNNNRLLQFAIKHFENNVSESFRFQITAGRIWIKL